METNKMDKNIKQKLQDRTFTPSNSAWERLSVQLDEQPIQNRRGWFFYISIAASFLILVSITIKLISNNSVDLSPKKEIITKSVETNIIDKKIEKIINEMPAQEAVAHKKINSNTEHKIAVKETKQYRKINISSTEKQNAIIFEDTRENFKSYSSKRQKENKKIENVSTQKTLKRDPKNSIKVNSEDLLYAVTHSPQQVQQYYAKYNLTREDILKKIKGELKKSNVKVNPNTILAEVERAIGKEDFQNNFMKSLKSKIADIATVIASRND